MRQREGIPTETITLWMLGGVAQSAAPFRSPGVEARVALAGPAVSAILAIGLVAGGHVVGLPASIAAVLEWLGWTNVLLLAFNMLPALPLDGGRVLRAALWRIRRSQLRATRDAARVSQVLATGMISVGVLGFAFGSGFGALWLTFVGLFVLSAASAEGALAQTRAALAGVKVADVMTADPVTIAAKSSAQQLIELAHGSGHAAYPVVDEHGDAIGLVSVLSAEQVPERRRAWVTVRKLLAEAGEPLAFDAEEEILAAVPGLATNPLQHAVVLRAGRLVGVVSLADVTRFARTRGADDLPPATPEEFARAGGRRPAGAAP